MNPSVALIQQHVAGHFGLPLAAMKSPIRTRDIVRPRQVAMYLAKRMTARSLPEIGRLFDRDHSTVFYAVRVVEDRRAADVAFDREVAALADGLAA